MQITPQIAVYILLFLPGLLGHAIFCAFTYTERPTWSGRTVVAIVLSATSYLSLAFLREVSWLRWLPDPQSLLTAADKGVAGTLAPETILCVFAACLLGFVYSLGLVWSHNRRTLHRMAAKLHLTTKSGYINEWDSVMIEQARSRWVLVAMKDGTSFVGWLKSHDVCSPDRSIVLEKVRQQDKEDNGFAWPESELLVINSMSDVRFLRLIPIEEVPDEQANSEQGIIVASGNRYQIGESEPKPVAEGTRARSADAARCIAGEDGQVINAKHQSKEASNG